MLQNQRFFLLFYCQLSFLLHLYSFRVLELSLEHCLLLKHLELCSSGFLLFLYCCLDCLEIGLCSDCRDLELRGLDEGCCDGWDDHLHTDLFGLFRG